jgi:hypothetical protein
MSPRKARKEIWQKTSHSRDGGKIKSGSGGKKLVAAELGD